MAGAFARRLIEAGSAGCAVITGYELVLLAAALAPAGEGEGERSPDDLLPYMVVLVPAHDEEEGLPATLAALARASYPRERLEVVVVADNCSDRTAEVAARAGATAWERDDPVRRGKGHALTWALSRVLDERPHAEGVAIVDADCAVSDGFLTAVGGRLARGARAVQADYAVANPEASPAAAARFAAFVLVNTVKPLGRTRLGFSCGLLGTGMAFAADLLRAHPWRQASLVEDRDYHLDLVRDGERVVFAADARVSSDMPTLAGAGQAQQERWEGGRLDLVRRRVGPLAARAVRRRDRVLLQAVLDELVPPRSLTVASGAVLCVAGTALGSRLAGRLALAAIAGQVAFVVGGLAAVRAPASAYRALALAPVLIVSKLGVVGRLIAGRGPSEWVRTERDPRR